MKTITYYKSKTGNTKCNHIIYNENVSIKSQSSLILLNEYLAEQDEDNLNAKLELQEYLNKRHTFLENELKKGDLVCHYCGKEHLEIGFREIELSNLNNKNPKLATIDHVIPVSSGIDFLDETNWVVSCKKCNNRKGSMNYDDFKNRNKKTT